jgi:hypothetical protein
MLIAGSSSVLATGKILLVLVPVPPFRAAGRSVPRATNRGTAHGHAH